MQTSTRDAQELAVARALEKIIAWLRDTREPAGLSASGLSALGRLETLGPLRVTELASLDGLTQPGMTTLINRLEEAGLATREADPHDGRAVRVSITPSGIERVRDYRESRAVRILSRIEELDAEDRRALLHALPALDHFTV
jgi:DNA-binding MarR family transcriptional regulator